MAVSFPKITIKDVAKKAGVSVANRSVFLDNDLSPKAIKYQMERLLGIA
ncbi:MAG: divergent polysaccharide deacetylase family protein, partial [Candidatus Omnitrophica bacterium]|nr:divergent polysaccharide deacetylase family protein [Candidatus Omnitrophota bacterium]